MENEIKTIKKEKWYYVFIQEGYNDYSVVITENLEDELCGCSVRGTKQDIIDELLENTNDFTIKELQEILL